ncbi:MAG TPA: O-antigen ligase family protein [Methylomirabilota bacterium]|nr:O-antigen ligase family protein [Methylomirabilota bacterium]
MPVVLAILALLMLATRTGGDARLFAALVLVAGGAWLAVHVDGWAGVFLAYCALLTLITPSEQRGLVAVQLLALGLLAYALIRRGYAFPYARPVLVALGAAQAVYALAQAAGFDRPEFLDGFRATGTMGNPNWAGSAMAMTGALSPPVLLPLFAAGLVACGHRLGLVAFAAAVAWRWRRYWRWSVPAAAFIAVVLTVATLLDPDRDVVGSLDSFWNRGAAWGYGLTLWLHNGVLLGLGPNGWATYMPSYQFALGQPGGLFLHAHNEPLQVLVEAGLIGFAILTAWTWSARATVWTSWGPAVVALGILSVGMFPFRVPALGMLAAVVVGAAMEERTQSVSDGRALPPR